MKGQKGKGGEDNKREKEVGESSIVNLAKCVLQQNKQT